MDDLDHRSLGTRLDLWHIQEGCARDGLLASRVATRFYRVLEDYIRRKMRRLGYAEVRTPQLSASGAMDSERAIGRGSVQHMFNFADGETSDGAQADVVPVPRPDIQQGPSLLARPAASLRPSSAPVTRDEPSGSLHGLMRTARVRAGRRSCVLFARRTCPVRSPRFRRPAVGSIRRVGFSKTLRCRSLLGHSSARRFRRTMGLGRKIPLAGPARQCGLSYDIPARRGRLLRAQARVRSSRIDWGRSWQCGTVQLDSVLPSRLKRLVHRIGRGFARLPLMIHHGRVRLNWSLHCNVA